ncbi:hypothetical protein AWV80_31295 [Cupriavidus sp. UYMU48A]|nr:hypothetical protein AWV80_31295 [Cupriavidus sp. UYMU48A]
MAHSFVFGLLIAPLGLWIRRNLEEPKDREESSCEIERENIAATIAGSWKAIITTFLLTAAATTSAYVIIVYMPTFAVRQFNIPLHEAFKAQSIGLLVFLIIVPLAGHLSDIYGRKIVMLTSLIPYALLGYPLFSWVQQTPSFLNLLAAYALLCFFIGGYFGPFSTAMGEQFPKTIRSSGLAIATTLPW